MKEIIIGSFAEEQTTVSNDITAASAGSGSLDVFATPSIVMLMEKAACSCLADYLEGDETTVGTEISVQHTSATPAGMKITAEAEVTAVSGREITFRLTAWDSAGEIGNGTHKRFLVYGEKFMAKTAAKLPD